jgi:hypothetical protein
VTNLHRPVRIRGIFPHNNGNIMNQLVEARSNGIATISNDGWTDQPSS